MTRNADEALEAIVTERGALISSADCTSAEIAIARSYGRFFVREDGMGFVIRPNEWLRIATNDSANLLTTMYDVLRHCKSVLRGKGWIELQISIEKALAAYKQMSRSDVGGEAEVGADDPPAKPLGTFEHPYPSAGSTGWQDRRCDKCQWLMHHTRLKGWVCPNCD